MKFEHNKEFDAVEPLDQEVRSQLRLTDLMMWSEKTGQVVCYIIVYADGVQFQSIEEKNGKTYTNYFKSYDAVKNHYNFLKRKGGIDERL